MKNTMEVWFDRSKDFIIIQYIILKNCLFYSRVVLKIMEFILVKLTFLLLRFPWLRAQAKTGGTQA